MKRLLAIRLRTLGDVVLTTPALRALHRGHPDAEIDVVTDAVYAPLLEGQPGVARVFGIERGTAATLPLLRALRRRGYDGAVDFFGNPRSALIAGAAGARWTAGYDLRGRGRAYRIKVPRTVPGEGGQPEYAAATHVRLAAAVGGVPDGLDARLHLPDAAHAAAEAALRDAGVRRPRSTVAMVPAATWATKSWPLSHGAVLCRRLIEAGWEVLLITGPGEERERDTMRSLVPAARSLPRVALVTMAAAIARVAALVGTDSGPRHLAAAFGLPTFSWFGPALPGIWTPRDPRHGVWWTDLPCRGCNRTACPHWNCLPGLAPETGSRLVLDHLERHVRQAPALGPAAGA